MWNPTNPLYSSSFFKKWFGLMGSSGKNWEERWMWEWFDKRKNKRWLLGFESGKQEISGWLGKCSIWIRCQLSRSHLKIGGWGDVVQENQAYRWVLVWLICPSIHPSACSSLPPSLHPSFWTNKCLIESAFARRIKWTHQSLTSSFSQSNESFSWQLYLKLCLPTEKV